MEEVRFLVTQNSYRFNDDDRPSEEYFVSLYIHLLLNSLTEKEQDPPMSYKQEVSHEEYPPLDLPFFVNNVHS